MTLNNDVIRIQLYLNRADFNGARVMLTPLTVEYRAQICAKLKPSQQVLFHHLKP